MSERPSSIDYDVCREIGFTLSRENPTAPPRPTPIENNERKRQTKLLTGLDCLSGQENLFETDGLI